MLWYSSFGTLYRRMPRLSLLSINNLLKFVIDAKNGYIQSLNFNIYGMFNKQTDFIEIFDCPK